MDLPNRVLELLYDRGEGYFSLAELGEAAGVSPKRADKAMEMLCERGHKIDRSPGHGVRLVRPLLLDAHLIERNLGTRRVGKSAICFEELDSTNDVAFDSARQRDTDGLAVLAEWQRRGRGRMGRRWVSPPHTNILLSVLLTDCDPERFPHEALTIATGLGVAEGIEAVCRLRCTLKWPNDVLLDGEKLSGVMVELRGRAGWRCVVLGIGINVNAAPPASEVDFPATSLADHLGEQVERTEVVRGVLQRLDEWVARISQGQLEELHDTWISRCGMLNERVTVVCGERRYAGRVLDVSPLEGIILCCDDGSHVHLLAEHSTIVHSSEDRDGRE